jgi:Family of unknown function (DUF6152)
MHVKTRMLLSASAAIAALTISFPVIAHHGGSDYDVTQVTSVKGGTVTRFEFVNPHVEIYWDFKNDNGVVEHWHAQGTTPNILYRNGWSKESLAPGTALEVVEGNRCKNGDTCMRLRKIVLAGGQELAVPQ